jgi:hypothetical protein
MSSSKSRRLEPSIELDSELENEEWKSEEYFALYLDF